MTEATVRRTIKEIVKYKEHGKTASNSGSKSTRIIRIIEYKNEVCFVFVKMEFT